MLILTRKPGESITIGDDIKIQVIEIKGKQVRLGIDAPKSLRDSLADAREILLTPLLPCRLRVPVSQRRRRLDDGHEVEACSRYPGDSERERESGLGEGRSVERHHDLSVH